MNKFFAWEALIAAALGCAFSAAIVGCEDSSVIHDFDTKPSELR